MSHEIEGRPGNPSRLSARIVVNRDERSTGLTIVEIGPRGGWTVAGLRITDSARRELILALGGGVPEAAG